MSDALRGGGGGGGGTRRTGCQPARLHRPPPNPPIARSAPSGGQLVTHCRSPPHRSALMERTPGRYALAAVAAGRRRWQRTTPPPLSSRRAVRGRVADTSGVTAHATAGGAQCRRGARPRPPRPQHHAVAASWKPGGPCQGPQTASLAGFSRCTAVGSPSSEMGLMAVVWPAPRVLLPPPLSRGVLATGRPRPVCPLTAAAATASRRSGQQRLTRCHLCRRCRCSRHPIPVGGIALDHFDPGGASGARLLNGGGPARPGGRERQGRRRPAGIGDARVAANGEK